MKRLIKSYTRRDILKAGAASAFAINFFPSRVFGANERLAVAGIGAGGKGRADIAGSAAAGADKYSDAIDVEQYLSVQYDAVHA